ncbi:hypothetical protein F4818DRAFT_426047 [Hypoxylon cercidicola]|nr:hypothetical protein F4818DRAFT_426047 [Hypoxylon cercidicola]
MQLAGWSNRQTSFPLCSISYGTPILHLMPLLLLCFPFRVLWSSLSDTLFYILVSFFNCLSLHSLNQSFRRLWLSFSFSLSRSLYVVRVLSCNRAGH